MLQFSAGPTRHDCSGVSRRGFLRAGALGLGGFTLPQLLAARAAQAAAGSPVRDTSVVLLFLQGGPSQFETFDPKMEAPAEIRSVTGEIKTRLPGITFGRHFEKLAARTDRLAIIRSFASGNGDHQNYLAVAGGENPLKTPMSTLYARVAGTNHPATGVPRNVLITPEATGGNVKLGSNFETDSLKKLLAAGEALGASYAAFDPSGGGPLRRDMQLNLPLQRFGDRQSLLAELDAFRRLADRTGTYEKASAYEQQALDVLTRGVAEAFDVSRESAATLARYDTSHLFRLADVHRWGDMRRSSNLLGRQLLLARRLCEAGAGFVTVMDAGWDMHANGNSPKQMAGLDWLAHQVDHAVAAFLDDVQERGLADKILLVVTGEMGRTPRINNNGGRDHWSDLTPLLVAGGGLAMGQVIGASDRQGGRPASERYTPRHLLATAMHVLLDGGVVRTRPEIPSDVAQIVAGGTPIPELV